MNFKSNPVKVVPSSRDKSHRVVLIFIMKVFSKIVLSVLILTLYTSPLKAGPFGGDQPVGKKAPEFTLNDINGRPFSLSSLRGKVVLLNFWAIWCPPCIQEFPSFVRLKSSMKGKPFEIVSVAIDSPLKNISAFARKKGANFPVLYDGTKKVSRSYTVFSLPTTFLIDREGRIVERFFGAHDWDSNEFKEKLERLF